MFWHAKVTNYNYIKIFRTDKWWYIIQFRIHNTDGFGGIYMQQTTILSELGEILQHATSILFGLQDNKTVSNLKAEL